MARTSLLPQPRPAHVSLVTGASSGIGAQLAHELGRRGRATFLVARRSERLADLRDELRAAYGAESHYCAADLTLPAGRTRVIDALRNGGLVVDILVNNAGFGSAGEFSSLPRQLEVDQVRVNCEAVVDMTSAFLPEMVHRGEGAILNVASTAGFQPLLAEAVYSASKAFVLHFSDSLHCELRHTGVTVTALCPGPVRTEFQAVSGDPADSVPAFRWRTAEVVARAGIEGLSRGERVVVVGWPNRITTTLGRYSPRPVLLAAASRRFRRRVVPAPDSEGR